MKKLIPLSIAALIFPVTMAASTAPAEAAVPSGCSRWVTTYRGYMGVTIYRGNVICYHNIPGTQYRAKIKCSLWPDIAGPVVYGKWKNESSLYISKNSCPWPWQLQKTNIIVQTR